MTASRKTQKETAGAPDVMPSSATANVSGPTNSSTNAAPSISSAAVTHARKTATPDNTELSRPTASAANSSALLTSFARALYSAKTPRQSVLTLPGLGDDSSQNSNASDTLSSPSASARVALGLTSGKTACSCSPNFRAPTARDWKGMSAKSWRDRTTGDPTPTLPDQIGGVPHPEFVEQLLGFPTGWTDLNPSGTPSSQTSQNTSDD